MSLDKNDLKAIADLMEQKSPINNRLDKMDSRLDAMDSRLDAMDSRLDAMDSRLDAMDSRLDAMDSRFDRIENRLDKVESNVSSLRAGQIEIRKDLKALDDKVSETYQLALDAWGKSTENRTWLEKSQYSV